ncbi:hypothetical protein D9619_013309 [Psilocybe cf. subviscida]|uniref:F-box domain-containing protein n=1 Tax=Psilocybe cf. subviscida TaxID=2480587 RepID=A0A8H5BTW3_9AGAR|nr:hypothetical protein D9619_013309 [Psilocybe cf. subviscida]
MMSSSATGTNTLILSQQVLTLPELIATIFSFMERKHNFQNALVCRIWSACALGEVWCDVDDFHALLGLLAPLILEDYPNQKSKYIFSRKPTTAGWQNFDKYSAFVRVLSYKEVTGKHPLSPHIFADISQTRPRNIILPRLRQLVWDPPDIQATLGPRMRPVFVLLFLHSEVTSVSITFPDVPTAEPQGSTLLQIAARAPNLDNLTLNTAISPAWVEIQLCTVISKLPSLKVINLPRGFFTTRIFNTCSRLPDLHTMDFGFKILTTTRGLDQRPLIPDVFPNGFPVLQRFELSAGFPDITSAMNALPAPQMLRYLYLESGHVAAEDIGQLIDHVSSSSKELRMFIFSAVLPFGERDINNIPPPVTLRMLKPLTSLPKLIMLSLDHATPFALSLDDIDSLLSGLPYIVYMTLNTLPKHYEQSQMSLDLLVIAGRRCRWLKKLGVFIDVTLPVAALSLKALPKYPVLPYLRNLSVGLSVITKETTRSTALLLSMVIPVTCSIEFGGRWASPKSQLRSKSIP